jgi:hypothetical protein
LNAICLLVAGVVRATLPATEFVVAWNHSVEKSRWEERYRVDGVNLRLVEARVQGFGAGMEPAADAVLRDGWWTWHPGQLLASLRLTLSPFTTDYDLCWRAHCERLGDLISPAHAGGPDRDARTPVSSGIVEVRACTATRGD